jgi:hypothetical protein
MSHSTSIPQNKIDLPRLDHRLYLASYDAGFWGVSSLIEDMAQTATGVLSLLESYCSSSYELANAYHGFHSVRQTIDDMNEVMAHLYANWEAENPNSPDGLLVLKEVVQPTLSRAKAVISLLCSLHAEDEAQEKPETIQNAISSVCRELNEASLAVTDFLAQIKQSPQESAH